MLYIDGDGFGLFPKIDECLHLWLKGENSHSYDMSLYLIFFCGVENNNRKSHARIYTYYIVIKYQKRTTKKKNDIEHQNGIPFSKYIDYMAIQSSKGKSPGKIWKKLVKIKGAKTEICLINDQDFFFRLPRFHRHIAKSNFIYPLLGWQDFSKSLKFHNFKTFPHLLGPKDYRNLKFSKVFDRLALSNWDWNSCTRLRTM